MIKKMTLMIVIGLFTILGYVCKAPGIDEKVSEDSISLAKEVIADMVHQQFIVFENGRYRDSIRHYESSTDWTRINEIGCFGFYQFQERTLHFLGYVNITLAGFKKNPGIFPPDIQDQAFAALLNSNWSALKDYQCYIGTRINGVTITKAGLLAAAHLAGADNVKKYLITNGTYIMVDQGIIEIRRSNEKLDADDINGTSVSKYLELFSEFQI